MRDVIDIQPGTVAQVAKTMKGLTVIVDDDVQGVANDLRAISPDLHLHYDPEQDLWVVMQLHDGTEKLVTTAQECDQRIVARVLEITAPGYDLGAEIAKAEEQAERDNVYRFSEQMGDHAERLAHALGRDLGRHEIARTRSSRAVVPRDLPPDAA